MSNDRITSLEALRKRKEMLRKELDEGFTSPFDNLKNMLGKYTSCLLYTSDAADE